MQTSAQSIITIIAFTVAVWLTRYLPFIIFPEHKEPPLVVQYLGKALPYASIGMIVVYCLKGISFTTSPYGIPEFLAITVVALLQWFKNSPMLSIGAGTIFYMFLVQVVF